MHMNLSAEVFYTSKHYNIKPMILITELLYSKPTADYDYPMTTL